MTPGQKQHIRQSFDLVAPIAAQTAGLFYSRLFELDPGLRTLFPGDLKAHGVRLIDALGFCVDSLEAPDALVSSARLMGERHAGFGVGEAHYEMVGIAMMWTLQATLGPAFSLSVREAWATLYRTLASAMKEGARSVLSREPTRVTLTPSTG